MVTLPPPTRPCVISAPCGLILVPILLILYPRHHRRQIFMPEAVEKSPSPFFVTEVPIDWPMWLEQVRARVWIG